MSKTLNDIRHDVENYQKNVYLKDAVSATNDAKIKLRDHIARTHPKRVRGHDAKSGYYVISKNPKFTTPHYVNGRGMVVPFMIYADYFSRWYNTGAFGRTIKKRGSSRIGMKGPRYSAQGNYFLTYHRELEQVARDVIIERLERSIKETF